MGLLKKIGNFITSLEKEEISKPLWHELNMHLMKSYGVMDGMTLFTIFCELITGQSPASINGLISKLNEPFNKDQLAGQLIFVKFITNMYELKSKGHLSEHQARVLEDNFAVITEIFRKASAKLKTG